MSKKIFCSKKPETLKQGGGPLDTSYSKVSWQYHYWFGYRSFPEYVQFFTSRTVCEEENIHDKEPGLFPVYVDFRPYSGFFPASFRHFSLTKSSFI